MLFNPVIILLIPPVMIVVSLSPARGMEKKAPGQERFPTECFLSLMDCVMILTDEHILLFSTILHITVPFLAARQYITVMFLK